jgi:hypothetical protein
MPKYAFIFPHEEDISIYLHEEIVCVLTQPKVSRGVHYFSEDFMPYANGLR